MLFSLVRGLFQIIFGIFRQVWITRIEQLLQTLSGIELNTLFLSKLIHDFVPILAGFRARFGNFLPSPDPGKRLATDMQE